jgi:hypothetical protein
LLTSLFFFMANTTVPVPQPRINIIQGTSAQTVAAAVDTQTQSLNNNLIYTPFAPVTSQTAGAVVQGSIAVDPVQAVSVNNTLNFVVSVRWIEMLIP